MVIFDVELITLTTLPDRLNPVAFKLPPVMLPMATTVVAAVKPELKFNADTTLPLKLRPAAFKLPPAMLPLALTLAALTAADVIKLPPVMLPVTVATLPTITLPTTLPTALTLPESVMLTLSPVVVKKLMYPTGPGAR